MQYNAEITHYFHHSYQEGYQIDKIQRKVGKLPEL